MGELDLEIEDWHRYEFPEVAIEVIAEKLVEEACELLDDVRAGNVPFEEAADVFIVLTALARRAGIDIEAEARKKMAVNRTRHYRKRPDGRYVR